MFDYIILFAGAFLAGLVDAVVGGGGLILIPVLFSVFPQLAPATLLGTNKVASIAGTTSSALSYARQIKIKWSAVVPAAFAAFILSFSGAFIVTHIPTEFIRKSLPFILIVLVIYTLCKKDFGKTSEEKLSGSKEKIAAILIGGGVGFYDGLFGPGTGSFLIFLFIKIFGYDFLRASATAKVINVATNFAALIWFSYSGHIIWLTGILMAVFNISGAVIGARLAIKHGSGFVRILFIWVVIALIIKTGYDAFFK